MAVDECPREFQMVSGGIPFYGREQGQGEERGKQERGSKKEQERHQAGQSRPTGDCGGSGRRDTGWDKSREGAEHQDWENDLAPQQDKQGQDMQGGPDGGQAEPRSNSQLFGPRRKCDPGGHPATPAPGPKGKGGGPSIVRGREIQEFHVLSALEN
jgi:hypothetical protein